MRDQKYSRMSKIRPLPGRITFRLTSYQVTAINRRPINNKSQSHRMNSSGDRIPGLSLVCSAFFNLPNLRGCRCSIDQ